MDHVLRYHDDPDVKIIVVLGEVSRARDSAEWHRVYYTMYAIEYTVDVYCIYIYMWGMRFFL